MGGIKLCYLGFTAFDTLDNIVTKLEGHYDYLLIGGEEQCPDTGRKHYHGLVYSKQPKCWQKLCGNYHLEKSLRDIPGWIDYCTKIETKLKDRIGIEKGLKPSKLIEKKNTGERSDDSGKPKNEEILQRGLQELIKEDRLNILRYDSMKQSLDRYILDTTVLVDADRPKGIWIYGDPGVGKSYCVRQYYKDIFLKPQNKWWDGYKGEKTILLDDLDSPQLGHLLKIWADVYGFNGEVKKGTIPLCYDRFIITSNYTPYELFKDNTSECMLVKAIERRFEFVHKLSKEHQIFPLGV